MKDHSGLDFPLQEYKRRLDLVRQSMKEQNLDLIMLNAPDNITYLTGYQTSGYGTFGALFIPIEGDPFMVTRLLEESNVITRTWVEKTHPYGDSSHPLTAVREAIEKFAPKAKTFGIEESCFFLTAPMQRQLKESFEHYQIRDCTGLVEKHRLIKSELEIDFLKKAAQSTEAGMRAAIDCVKSGITENEIAGEVHRAMFKAGGEYPCVPPYITSGERTIIGHATWEGRVTKPNEVVFVEIGGCFRRYHTGMMRTFYLGDNPPKELKMAEEHVNKNIETLMGMMKPGVTSHEIDTFTRDPEELKKFGATQISRTGYSMGISYAPAWDEGHILSLQEGDHTPLDENMVFHLIPWLQLPNLQTVMGLSETVVVKPDGAQSLYNLERKMFLKS